MRRIVFVLLWILSYSVAITIGVFAYFGDLTVPTAEQDPFVPSLIVVLMLPISLIFVTLLESSASRIKEHASPLLRTRLEVFVQRMQLLLTAILLLSLAILFSLVLIRYPFGTILVYTVGLAVIVVVSTLVEYSIRSIEPPFESIHAHRQRNSGKHPNRLGAAISKPASIFRPPRIQKLDLRSDPTQVACLILDYLKIQNETATVSRTNMSHRTLDGFNAVLLEASENPAVLGLLGPSLQIVDTEIENLGKPDWSNSRAVAEKIARTFRYINHLVPSGVRIAKRSIDLFVSGIVLLFTFPLFPLILLAIKLEARRGTAAFLMTPRLGQYGREFQVFRFNSSISFGQDSILEEHSSFRRFILYTGLDRLPTFVNVLLGQMSLVGPAPVYFYIMTHDTDLMILRLIAKPGLISRAQLLSYKEPKDCLTYINMDLDYIERMLNGTGMLLEDLRLIREAFLLFVLRLFDPKKPESSRAYAILQEIWK